MSEIERLIAEIEAALELSDELGPVSALQIIEIALERYQGAEAPRDALKQSEPKPLNPLHDLTEGWRG